MSLALLLFAARANGSEPTKLFPNGSFEEGQTTPVGWHIRAGGEWATGEAHHGGRYLSGRSAKEGVVAESERVVLQPNTNYRMHGWLRRPNGEGRLGVDLLNQHCQIVRQQQAPRVRGGSEWRYVALECKPDMPETAARVWFRVKGQADLDDAGLAFAPASFMGNKALEADNRGRIPFWSEEKVDTLFPGKRAGEFRTDTNVTRRGKSVRW